MEDEQKLENVIEYDEKGDRIIPQRQLTLEQKKYFDNARQKHRQNITKQQIVQGKVFKGIAFISKPDKILFKDFTVGKIHSLTIQLTNVSNAFNSFNILPLNQRIRNFFEVEYTPHGKISPGLSCPITIRFIPVVNQDINDYFCILAETGKIQYPIECSSKKTIVTCSNLVIDFGKVIFGQKGSSNIILKNQGSLSSEFYFKNIDGIEIFGKKFKPDQNLSKLLNQLNFQKSGQIGGNTQLKIPIQFVPQQVGLFQLSLQIHMKNFKYSPPIIIKIQAECIELPVYIQQQLYDLELCLINHLYRRKLIFHNKSENPMKVQIIQPADTKKYFQFNPMLGFIQKQAQMQVWVKIMVEKDLPLYLNKYMIQQDLYELSFKLVATGQLMPVPFRIKFKLTTDTLIIKPMNLQFGTIFQGTASKILVSFQNKSQLPQQVMIYPLPKQISVQNDQSRFKILPKQTIQNYIIFKTEKLIGMRSKKQQGFLSCKIITGNLQTQQMRLNYNCSIQKPALLISKNKIDLPALQIDQIYSTYFEIKNDSSKILIFEIFLPYFEISGLKMTPMVKTLTPNQVVQINIQYHSFMKKLKALTLRQLEQKYSKNVKSKVKEQKQSLPPVQPPKKQSKKESKDSKKETKLTKQQQQQLEAEQRLLEQQQRQRLQKQRIQKQNLQKNFDGTQELSKLGGKFYQFSSSQHYQWVLPVYFKIKDLPNASSQVTFISVTTTSIEKKLLLDKTILDFGEVAVGTRKTQQLKITNLAQQSLLKKEQLPVFSGFSIINSLRRIGSNKKFSIIVEFQPHQQQPFQQVLRLFTEKNTISCRLKGKGVRPEVKLEPQSGLLNMGNVLLDEFTEKTFKIKNITNFKVMFQLDKKVQGIKNTSSIRAFSFIPTEGYIEPHGFVQIKVKFKPDRVSDKFYELIHVFVPQQKDEKRIFIWGSCYSRQAYVSPFRNQILPKAQDLPKKIEYAYDSLRNKDQQNIYSPLNNKIVLQFKKIVKGVQNVQSCFKKKLTFGSCKLLDPKLQKPTNFQINLPKDDKFTCDNIKGTVAAGNQVTVTFTYKPPEVDPFISSIQILNGTGQWKDIKAQLKLSGGFSKPGTQDVWVFEIILRAYVNQI